MRTLGKCLWHSWKFVKRMSPHPSMVFLPWQSIACHQINLPQQLWRGATFGGTWADANSQSILSRYLSRAPNTPAQEVWHFFSSSSFLLGSSPTRWKEHSVNSGQSESVSQFPQLVSSTPIQTLFLFLWASGKLGNKTRLDKDKCGVFNRQLPMLAFTVTSLHPSALQLPNHEDHSRDHMAPKQKHLQQTESK